MTAGYTRQSAGQIINGAIIEATHFNNEYNALENAFSAASGHNHDGTTGGGAPIPLGGGAVSGQLPPQAGGTGVANNSASTITITGAYALTITLSGATSLTFPTSGTLLTSASKLSDLAATSSAELKTVISDETGSGALVFATSPTLVTPILGTPTSGTLTNCTGYAISNLASIGTNIPTFLTTPSSANLAAAITDETGSGALVFANTPTLVTPVLGVATATSINGLTISNSTGTLTISNSKVVTISNTLTFSGTDSSSVAFGAGGTVAYLGTVQSFSKSQTLTPQSLTSTSNSIAWDVSNGNNAKHTATENTTLANPTNLVDGMVLTFRWLQHASSAKTLAFGSKWKFQGTSTVSTTLSSSQLFTGRYDSTSDTIETIMTGPFA